MLFISSYSMDWTSVPKQIAGIRESLGDAAQIEYLFMDTKNLGVERAREQFKPVLKNKLSSTRPYDLIVIGDDDALNFALDYESVYFPGIPIIFEGINDENHANIVAAENPLVTGVVEKLPLKETISIAQKIYPQANRVLAISDGTTTGVSSAKQYLAAAADFPELQFDRMNPSELTAGQIQEQLSKVDKHTILLYMVLQEDADGNHYTVAQGVARATATAPVPIFRADETGLRDGRLGGSVIS